MGLSGGFLRDEYTWSVLTGTAAWTDFSIKCPNNLLKGALQYVIGDALLIAAAMTLPEVQNIFGFKALRVLLFPFILYNYVSMSIDHSITFGAPLRDFWLPVICFSRMMSAIDICLSSLLDKTDHAQAPRWLVPKSQAWRFPDSEPLPMPARFSKKAEGEESSPIVGHSSARAELLPLAKVELDWYAVPHNESLLSWRRLLWGVDHLYTYRASTSLVFPREQRAMEWAHVALVDGALHPETSVFGLPEHDGPLWPWVKIATFIVMASQTRLLILEPPTTFYDLPFWHRSFILVFEASVLVCVPPILEFYLFPILLKRNIVPSTAIPRLMNNPTQASGTTDYWGKRWHTVIRRKVCRVAMLFPFGQTSMGNKLGAFVVSGALHSWMLIRFYQPPPTIWHSFVFLVIPGPLAFFTAQGLSAALEIALLGPPPRPGQLEARPKRIVRRLSLLLSGLVSGGWFAAALANVGAQTWQSQRSMLPEGWFESFKACMGA